MRQATRIFAVTLVVLKCVFSKTFTACELAVELGKPHHNVPLWQIPTWVCIAHHATQYDTSHDDGIHYGIFRVWGRHWCKECKIPCDKLTDDDLTDDIKCVVHKVYHAHSRHGSNGFEAWGNIYDHCHKPWMDLHDSDCKPRLELTTATTGGSSGSHNNSADDRSSEYHFYDDYYHAGDFTENPPYTPTPESTSSSIPKNITTTNRRFHHIVLTDAGILILVLLCVLVTGAVIESFRRNGLHFSRIISVR